MVQKAWLFMSADYYPGVFMQERAMKEYCTQNGIEVLGSTLSVHYGMADEGSIRMAMQKAVENKCDCVMVADYSLMRYSPKTYMELLSSYLEKGVTIYTLNQGDVFKTMPDAMRKRLG